MVGVRTASDIGQDFRSIISESDTPAGIFGTPEKRSLQQYIAEVEDYGQRLEEGLPQARAELADQILAPLRLGLRNHRQINLSNAQLRLSIDGVLGVALPPDGFEDWNPVDELPDPPRPWGPSPYLNPSVMGWPSPNLMGIYPEVEVTFQNGQTVLIYPAVDVRPGEFHALDMVVLFIPDTVERIKRAHWTLTATNVDGVVEGELDVEFLGAPRDN